MEPVAKGVVVVDDQPVVASTVRALLADRPLVLHEAGHHHDGVLHPLGRVQRDEAHAVAVEGRSRTRQDESAFVFRLHVRATVAHKFMGVGGYKSEAVFAQLTEHT